MQIYHNNTTLFFLLSAKTYKNSKNVRKTLPTRPVEFYTCVCSHLPPASIREAHPDSATALLVKSSINQALGSLMESGFKPISAVELDV